MQDEFRCPAVVRTSILFLAIVFLASGSLRAGMITFDNLPDGTKITDQYKHLGVIFRSNLGGATIFGDPSEATSPPNVLIGDDVFSDIFIDFVDAATGAPKAVNNVALDAISVGHNILTISSRDIFGVQLEQFVVQNLSGSQNGFGKVNPIAFSLNGIASIQFDIDTSVVGNLDGMGIDNLSFTAVPEPSSFVLIGAGIGLLYMRRMRNRTTRSRR